MTEDNFEWEHYCDIAPPVCHNWYTEWQKEVVEMSLMVALIGIDGIVVASDTRERVQFGDVTITQDDIHKLKTLSDSIVLSALGNLAGYCNYLVSYYVSKELVTPEENNQDVESFAHDFSRWANKEYRQATRGMEPRLLNLPSNRIEITVAGYNADLAPQIYVIRNDPGEPALVPHLLDVPYHVSGIISVGAYWLGKAVNLKPIHEMSVDVLKTIPFLMIREAAETSNAISLPMDMVILRPNTPIHIVSENEISQIEQSVAFNTDIDLMRLLGMRAPY